VSDNNDEMIRALVDEYLELPKEERPPFDEWASLKFEVEWTVFMAEYGPSIQAFAEWVKETAKDIAEAWAQWGANILLWRLRGANQAAAERRRKWRRKPSTVSF
jgi:hypothetical protein